MHFFGTDAVHRSSEYEPNSSSPSVHLSTVQSLHNKLVHIDPHAYDYVVIDEFHHAAAPTYRKLLSRIQPSFSLGLTATPFRSDQQDVVELFNGNIIVNFDLRSGINTGILVPYHYYGCFDDVDYSVIKRKTNGYTIRDLNKALIIPERDKAIIQKWKELADSLPTLAFCCSRDHARRMAQSFNESGIPAEVYLGDTPIEARGKLIEKLQYGYLKVLCAVDVLNEGADIPFVECLLFLRPTESKRIFYQQLGRGLRRSPGKDHVTVLDFIGNFHNAHRIVEYLGLHPEEQPDFLVPSSARTRKEILDLPIGCKVNFDEHVIDIFAEQILDPRQATRHNIAQILIYQYCRTSKRLGHPATRQEVDRYQILHSGLYKMVFGSWKKFQELMEGHDYEEDMMGEV